MPQLVLSAVLLLGAVACTQVPPPSGAGGASGGGGSGGAAGEGGVGGAAGTGGASGGGGTGGEPFVCDDGTGSGEGTECNTCLNCASADPCARETERCNASLACTSFIDCINGCDGGDVEACIDDCVSATPEGSSIFLIAQNCAFCQCPTHCWDNCQDNVLECDDGTVGMPEQPEVCNGCISCGMDGPCQASSTACDSSIECEDFATCDLDCFNGGGDAESCFTTCSETHPAGAALYYANATCVCAHCPTNCSGLEACDFY